MKFLFSASSTSHQITGKGNTKNRKFIYLENNNMNIEVNDEAYSKKEDNNKLAWYKSKIAAIVGTALLIGSGAINYYQYDKNNKLEEKALTEELSKLKAMKSLESYEITADDLTEKVESLKVNISDLEENLKNFKAVKSIPASAFTNKGELLKTIEASTENYFAIDEGEGYTYFVNKKANKIDNPNLIIKE